MIVGILFLCWVLLSLLTMGSVCFTLTVIYIVWPNKYIHQAMWFLYVEWTLMLGWWVRYFIPDLEVLQQTDVPEHTPYILLSNHYSWMDILVLYATQFSRERSFVFVMKRSLIWVPFIGVICWGLGHPMIYRGRARRKNLLALTGSAQKALDYHYGMMIFPEGTRYTKVNEPKSDFAHLLNPKSVGFECIIKSMGNDVWVEDVTLVYEHAQHGLWDLLFRKIGRVQVIGRSGKVRAEDAKQWITDAWTIKDRLIAETRQQPDVH